MLTSNSFVPFFSHSFLIFPDRNWQFLKFLLSGHFSAYIPPVRMEQSRSEMQIPYNSQQDIVFRIIWISQNIAFKYLFKPSAGCCITSDCQIKMITVTSHVDTDKRSAGILNGCSWRNNYGYFCPVSLYTSPSPTRRTPISYAVFCLKKKKKQEEKGGTATCNNKQNWYEGEYNVH